MATYYIAESGNDSSGDGSQGNPYRSLGKVLTVVNGTRADTIVEIMDEGSYTDADLTYTPSYPSSLTVRHTASHLGRPTFDATGGGFSFINFSNSYLLTSNITASFIGIELAANSSMGFFRGTFNNGLEFHVSGCFMHGSREMFYNGAGPNRTLTPVSTIKQSTLFFTDDGAGGDIIQAQNGFEISNCLLTSSAGFGIILRGIAGFGSNNVTASFCTIVSRRTNQQYPAVSRWGKLINCVVSSSGPGIQSDNHSYNLVIGNQSGDDTYSFLDSGGSPTHLGTGDIKGYPTFVDGSRIGNDPGFIALYALDDGSLGIDSGIAFDSISVDITGTERPQGSAPDMGAFELPSSYWQDADNSQTYSTNLDASYTIHNTANLLKTRKFPNDSLNRQAPYFVSIPGVPNLRGRTPGGKPYKAQVGKTDTEDGG
jgi:hypothetical protein